MFLKNPLRFCWWPVFCGGNIPWKPAIYSLRFPPAPTWFGKNSSMGVFWFIWKEETTLGKKVYSQQKQHFVFKMINVSNSHFSCRCDYRREYDKEMIFKKLLGNTYICIFITRHETTENNFLGGFKRIKSTITNPDAKVLRCYYLGTKLDLLS